MERKPTKDEVHVIVFPFPIQGHINPMLQFSKQLVLRGLRVTLVTTSPFSSKLSEFRSCSIDIETISDGANEAANPGNVDTYIERFDIVAPRTLAQLIERKIEQGHFLKCLIYDSSMPWGLDIARKFGIYGASFFTQSSLVSMIFYQVHKGMLSAPIQGLGINVHGMPLINEAKDLPSFVYALGLYPSLERLVLNQFSNVHHADWRFFNTIDGLESKAVNWMSSQWAVKTIGPAIPSMYLDKRLPDDKDYGLSIFMPETDTCIKWLDTKETNSVVYISMGSLASLGEVQMEEIALGLDKCNKHFLWVVRASEENKLRSDFKEKTSGKGLIVNWCPQLEVLNHPALGCFVTHCGWNSILEAISLGVPMVAFPQWTDQPTNAKCVMDFWNVGLRVKVNEKGVVTREEIDFCIRQVMEGEKAKQFITSANKWKQVAKEAMEEGGSSDRNIEEFATGLLSS